MTGWKNIEFFFSTNLQYEDLYNIPQTAFEDALKENEVESEMEDEDELEEEKEIEMDKEVEAELQKEFIEYNSDMDDDSDAVSIFYSTQPLLESGSNGVSKLKFSIN